MNDTLCRVDPDDYCRAHARPYFHCLDNATGEPKRTEATLDAVAHLRGVKGCAECQQAADKIERLQSIEQMAKDLADGTKEVFFADNLMGNDDVTRAIARMILTGEN